MRKRKTVNHILVWKDGTATYQNDKGEIKTVPYVQTKRNR